MSEQEPLPHPEPEAGGFADESTDTAEGAKQEASEKKPKRGRRASELKENFSAVFGHGIGKFALILTGLAVVVMVAFALRGLKSGPALDFDKAQVDVPDAPRSKVTVDPIDEREAQRRAEQATKEAEEAARRGQTYQPDFNPAVVPNQPGTQGGYAQPRLNVGDEQQRGRVGQQPVAITVPAGQSSANGGAGTQAHQQANAQQQEEQRRQQAERDKQLAARDKYVDQLRGGVKEQVEELLGGKGKEGGIRGEGAYTVVSYMPKQQAAAPSAGGGGVTGPATGAPESSAPAGSNKKPPIYKAGKAIFATLDSEVNTDDGGEVFATVRGGKYDGAKLIGKIEQAPRNIRLRFSVLSPQDDRPTLAVNAIAIREEDAKQGVAEVIDNHTLERYSALFAGSILAGLGKAAMQPTGETIVLPNGQVVVSQPELDNKRIAMYALGEIGINAGSEVRKNFSQPPTYITPANKGIGVIFLTDVNEK